MKRMNAILILMLLMLTVPCAATDRYFPDLTAVSPNGRFVLTAVSPDNAGEYPEAFADDFMYELRDTATDQVLWTRSQPPSERSPQSLFLDDETNAIIISGLDDAIVLAPVTGRVVLTCNIREAFPTEEQETYVRDTTAGPMWKSYSRWSFLELDRRTYFVVRAWWDRRVIIDVTNAALVVAPSAALIDACDAADRAFALATLRRSAIAFTLLTGQPPTPYWDGRDYEAEMRQAGLAVHLAGRMGLTEAVPDLRILELDDDIGSYSSSAWGRREPGEINPFVWRTLRRRQAVHLALRRIGETPRDLPCTQFVPDGSEEPVRHPYHAQPRHVRANAVQLDMTPREVLALLGGPDEVDRKWIYDVDAREPYTLKLHWNGRRVVRIEIVRPAEWMDGDTRYDSLI